MEDKDLIIIIIIIEILMIEKIMIKKIIKIIIIIKIENSIIIIIIIDKIKMIIKLIIKEIKTNMRKIIEEVEMTEEENRITIIIIEETRVDNRTQDKFLVTINLEEVQDQVLILRNRMIVEMQEEDANNKIIERILTNIRVDNNKVVAQDLIILLINQFRELLELEAFNIREEEVQLRILEIIESS